MRFYWNTGFSGGKVLKVWKNSVLKSMPFSYLHTPCVKSSVLLFVIDSTRKHVYDNWNFANTCLSAHVFIYQISYQKMKSSSDWKLL